MRIGVYGGTFDPVHIGHLAVAEAVRERAHLDRILFVPNNTQPLKHRARPASDTRKRVPGASSPLPAAPAEQESGGAARGLPGPLAPAGARLRMLRAAIAGNDAFDVSEIELTRPGPSYTVFTLDALRAAHPTAHLRFILGADAANTLPDWRTPARILAGYHPIIMTRAGYPGPDWTALERIHPDARRLADLIDVPHLAIASSALREAVAAGRSIRYLVPDAVLRIIREEGLYR